MGKLLKVDWLRFLEKKDKTKLQIIPIGAVKQEIWSLTDIADKSIEILA